MELILEKPVVSEKAALAVNNNKYVFYVDPKTNKIEIKRFIEDHFNVKVEKVNICNVKGKKRRRRQITGVTKARKKAIVTLVSGSEIKRIKEIF